MTFMTSQHITIKHEDDNRDKHDNRHGYVVTTYFLVICRKRDRECTPCVYIT